MLDIEESARPPAQRQRADPDRHESAALRPQLAPQQVRPDREHQHQTDRTVIEIMVGDIRELEVIDILQPQHGPLRNAVKYQSPHEYWANKTSTHKAQDPQHGQHQRRGQDRKRRHKP
jgi:hypothetical protein